MQKKSIPHKNTAKKHPAKIAALLLLICLSVMIAGSFFYISDCYHAEDVALELLNESPDDITITETENKEIIFMPEDPIAGLIFYPGAKVQYESYAPLMEQFARHGVLCVLVHMPGNLAIFNPGAAAGIKEQYPGVTDWYLGGHSLGGAMAASYVSSHADEYSGLLLLAAYSTKDLSATDLSVLSVYGSKDGVLNRESYDKYRDNLPSDYTETVISGGCHAFFGCYGAQKGDNVPTITREEQMTETADAFYELITRRAS